MTPPQTLTHQVLCSIVRNLPEWDEHGMATAAQLMSDVRPHHWGDAATRRIAETMLGHLRAGRSFGFISLGVDLPDARRTIERIRACEPVENIRTGLKGVTEQGVQADIRAAMQQAERDLQTLPALTVSATLAEAISSATANGEGYRHVSQIQSVVDHIREMQARPESVIRLGSLDRMLRWGGLPVSSSDGETILIVGVSSHGKTAWAIDIALRSAAQGHLTHYNVLADASAYQIRERMVHHLAGLNMREGLGLDVVLPPRNPRPRETVVERLLWAESVLNALPLEIDDSSPDMNQHELRVHLAHKAARGVRLSVIENLDHMRWDQREERLDRREQLGRLTQIVRQSDRRTGHHSILLAQANRAALEEGDGIPRGHHVADSDQPRRHATIVAGIMNPNLERGTDDLALKGFLGKNRSGQTGLFTLPASLINPKTLTTLGVPQP